MNFTGLLFPSSRKFLHFQPIESIDVMDLFKNWLRIMHTTPSSFTNCFLITYPSLLKWTNLGLNRFVRVNRRAINMLYFCLGYQVSIVLK